MIYVYSWKRLFSPCVAKLKGPLFSLFGSNLRTDGLQCFCWACPTITLPRGPEVWFLLSPWVSKRRPGLFKTWTGRRRWWLGMTSATKRWLFGMFPPYSNSALIRSIVPPITIPIKDC